MPSPRLLFDAIQRATIKLQKPADALEILAKLLVPLAVDRAFHVFDPITISRESVEPDAAHVQTVPAFAMIGRTHIATVIG